MNLSKAKEGVELLSDTNRFPNIPKDLVKHTRKCMKDGVANRLTRALPERPEATIKAIDTMFAKASQATGLSPDELLKATDFKYRDTHPTRITSAFAEIRSINFLQEEGFSTIRLLKAGSKRSADIVAEKSGVTYAIEVANSIYDAGKRFTTEQLKNWLLSRLLREKKMAQLRSTAAQFDSARRIFVAVVDTAATVALQTHEEFLEAAELAWRGAGEDPLLHICIVTGGVALGYGRDDSIFPPWPSADTKTVKPASEAYSK